MVGSDWNTNTQPSLSVAQSAENAVTSRPEKKRRNPSSRQRRSAKRLAKFLDKKRQLAADHFDPSCSGDSVLQLAVEFLLLLFLTKLLQLLRRPVALIMRVQLKILRFWLIRVPLLHWNCLAASKLNLRLGMILLVYGILPLIIQQSGHL